MDTLRVFGAENKADACALFAAVEGQCWTGSSSALVEPRATTDIDLLMLIEQPTREGIQSLLASQFDSTVVHPAPMVFKGISIWRAVGIRSGQDVVVDLLLADSDYLKTALSRRRMIVFGELNVPIPAIEDLIVLKTLAGRLQDQAESRKDPDTSG